MALPTVTCNLGSCEFLRAKLRLISLLASEMFLNIDAMMALLVMIAVVSGLSSLVHSNNELISDMIRDFNNKCQLFGLI